MEQKPVRFPPMYPVRQLFETTSIDDIKDTVRQQLANLSIENQTRTGQSIALAVGSRGIHHLLTILVTLIEFLQARGLKPFIIPAMGSHGGATAEGQVEVLRQLGITESAVGVSIIADMDVVELGTLDSGAKVFMAKQALEADQLIVVGRVKPHTAFRGDVESGLCKMLVIGCGKQKGAATMHKFGLTASIIPAAEMILEQAPVLGGLAVVENAYGAVHTLAIVPPQEFIQTDKKLLKIARRLLPSLPLEDLDILVVDEIGKNISGAGIDPNVTGFWRRDGGPKKPDFRTVIVLDITPQSNGNATGIGMADLTTRRVIDKISSPVTYANALTSGLFRTVRLPMALDNDLAVIRTALDQVREPKQLRMVRIMNTLRLETFWATKAVLPELQQQAGLVVDDTPLELQFDTEGRLLAFRH